MRLLPLKLKFLFYDSNMKCFLFLAIKQSISNDIFDHILNISPYWTCTIFWIICLCDNVHKDFRIIRHYYSNFCEPICKLRELKYDNRLKNFFIKRIEDDCFIDTIEKFWSKYIRESFEDTRTNLFIVSNNSFFFSFCRRESNLSCLTIEFF